MQLSIHKQKLIFTLIASSGMLFILASCGDNQKTKEVTKDFTTTIDNIKIDAGNLDVDIHEGKKFSVSARYVEGKKPNIVLKGKNLTISSGKSPVKITENSDKNPRIEVVIPKKNKIVNLTLKQDNGSTTCNNINAKVSEIKSISGDVTCKNFKGKNLKLTGENGNFNLSNISVENFELTQDIGDVICKKFNGKQLKLNDPNGEVDLSDISVASFNLQQDNGNAVITRLKTTTDSSISSNFGDIILSQLNVPGLDIETTNGSIILDEKKQAEKTYQKDQREKILKVRGNNGEIVVK